MTGFNDVSSALASGVLRELQEKLPDIVRAANVSGVTNELLLTLNTYISTQLDPQLQESVRVLCGIAFRQFVLPSCLTITMAVITCLAVSRLMR